MYLHYEMHKRMKRRKNIPLQLALPHKHIYLLYKMISFETKSQKQTKGFLVRKNCSSRGFIQVKFRV